MKKKNLILICARKGSKGIKNKNLRKVGDHSLVSHSIRMSKKLNKNYITFVSSDSPKILNISKSSGVNIIKRASNLSRDKTPEILVWKDALLKFKEKFDYLPEKLLVIPPTSPLRNLSDIKNCINKFKTKKFDLVITGYRTNHNPYFNMVKESGEFYEIVIKRGIYRRQDAPKVYNISTSCYLINSRFLMKTSNIYNGRVGLVEIPFERSIDIDNKLDLFIANKIYEKK